MNAEDRAAARARRDAVAAKYAGSHLPSNWQAYFSGDIAAVIDDARALDAALSSVEQERDASVEECRVLQVLLRQQTINHEERDAGWTRAECAEDRLEVVEAERDALKAELATLRATKDPSIRTGPREPLDFGDW